MKNKKNKAVLKYYGTSQQGQIISTGNFGRISTIVNLNSIFAAWIQNCSLQGQQAVFNRVKVTVTMAPPGSGTYYWSNTPIKATTQVGESATDIVLTAANSFLVADYVDLDGPMDMTPLPTHVYNTVETSRKTFSFDITSMTQKWAKAHLKAFTTNNSSYGARVDLMTRIPYALGTSVEFAAIVLVEAEYDIIDVPPSRNL